MTKKYRALTGIDTPSGRFEPGDIVAVPPKSVELLLSIGAIEPVDDGQDVTEETDDADHAR